MQSLMEVLTEIQILLGLWPIRRVGDQLLSGLEEEGTPPPRAWGSLPPPGCWSGLLTGGRQMHSGLHPDRRLPLPETSRESGVSLFFQMVSRVGYFLWQLRRG